MDVLVPILIYILSYILVSWPAGKLIARFTKRWQQELASDDHERHSLNAAGRYIGILERILILTFVYVGQFSAIGFLITAKSILRFNPTDKAQHRKQSEYILIGTLMSFVIAIAIAYLAEMLIFYLTK